MKLSLDLRTSLSQTLTPQQIQYLKLPQLPLVQLEQQVRQELEQNPMLEESPFEENSLGTDYDSPTEDNSFDLSSGDEMRQEMQSEIHADLEPGQYESGNGEIPHKELIDDQGDPFEFYKLIWQDDSDFGSKNRNHDEDDGETFQIKDTVTFLDELIHQLRLLPLTPEEVVLGEQIIGNVDSDGYLRRELQEIVEETNVVIAEMNYDLHLRIQQENKLNNPGPAYDNPARQFDISPDSLKIVNNGSSSLMIEEEPSINYKNGTNGSNGASGSNGYHGGFLNQVTIDQAEKVLKHVQSLDPPGIASRNIRECLIWQLRAIQKPNAAQKLALMILEEAYEPFAMKHFQAITKQLEVTEDYLREAIEVIRKLNPKPGTGNYQGDNSAVIPDFILERDEESDEIIITVNDSRMPALQLSKAYDKLKKEAKYKLFNKDTREWIRNKYEEAKFLIQAIRQRKSTMLKVMTAIAGLQRDFFYRGSSALRPLIYKDVAEMTGLDISTVCRIVNGKYVQTEYGTYELKYFFSESLPNDEGEEISTTVIKQILKDIIDSEPKKKPYSDDKIAVELKKKGYMVARRTIAKYREQLKIPVARLRKEL